MRISRMPQLALILVVFLGSCDNKELPPGPPSSLGPGLLAVILDTPNSNDGALLFTLSGGTLDSLRGRDVRVISSDAGSGGRRVIVSGAVGAGKILRFWVPERGDAANYTAVLEQAAGRSDFAQQDITDYSLSVVVD